MLTATADRRDTTAHHLGVAGLLTGGASALAGGVAGVVAIPFLPLLIAYTALLITTGEVSPPQIAQHQITAGGQELPSAAPPGAAGATAERAGPGGGTSNRP